MPLPSTEKLICKPSFSLITAVKGMVNKPLSSAGTVAMVGGTNDNNNGATWMYTSDCTNWAQYGNKIVGTGTVGAANQGSVTLSSNGTTAMIGGSNDADQRGAAWAFRAVGIFRQQCT